MGRPWTMQEIGLPTYWVAVITNEHVNSSTAVKWLCIRNSTESVTTSCRFRYLLSPPSNLYMIARTCRYREPRAARTTSPSRRRTTRGGRRRGSLSPRRRAAGTTCGSTRGSRGESPFANHEFPRRPRTYRPRGRTINRH